VTGSVTGSATGPVTGSVIVAASDNEVIGAGGALPWHLPGDLRRFRALTTGHAVVMGRVTYESILARLGKPLPGRTSVVMSRSGPTPAAPDGGHSGGGHSGGGHSGGQVRWAGSLDAALELAAAVAASAGDGEFFIAGGVTVYRDTLPVADRVYLTRVHAVVEGDRFMPDGWLAGFELLHREDASDPGADLGYEWLDYQRAPR
jgi:dihydrofolate reductase